MTPRKKGTRPAKGAFDIVDLITGRIGKITALVTAIGGLAFVILTQSEQIASKLTALGLYTPRPCVEIRRMIVPKEIQYSDWKKNKMKITIEGRNNCEAQLGIYLTYMRDKNSESLFDLKVPYDDWEECKGSNKALLQERICWETKKPLRRGKGDWVWNVVLPDLEQIGARPVEPVRIKFEVNDYDDPTRIYWSETVPIEVRNDAVPR
jgi:hypothetical protein